MNVLDVVEIDEPGVAAIRSRFTEGQGENHNE